jgi:DNA-binding GntR family transcriptional regulator
MSEPGRQLGKAERPASGVPRQRNRVSLTDACARALTEAIEQGMYPPGSPLPDRDKARRDLLDFYDI